MALSGTFRARARNRSVAIADPSVSNPENDGRADVDLADTARRKPLETLAAASRVQAIGSTAMAIPKVDYPSALIPKKGGILAK